MLRFPKLSIIALMLAVVMALSIGGGLLASGPSAGAELPTTLDVDPMPAFVGAGDAITSVNSDAGRDTLGLDEDAAAVDLINGDFEQGSGVGWFEYSLLLNVDENPLITDDLLLEKPHSGDFAVWLGGYFGYDEVEYIEQQVTVPLTATYLVYWHWIDSQASCGTDSASVLIDDTPIDEYELCADQNTGRWVPHSVDLSLYKGQTVDLQIQAEFSPHVESAVYIDDVSFEAEAVVLSLTYLPLVLRNPPVVIEILNGDFELGQTVWTESSVQRDHVILHEDDPEFTKIPHNGDWAALLGAAHNETSYIQQEVTVPPAAPHLVYWHWISSSDVCGYDVGGVLINGSIVKDYDLCSAENTIYWVQHSVNLSAYAGQTVQLRFQAETDDDDLVPSELYVDDVSFQSSAAVSTE